MFGESKFEVLRKIPEQQKPISILARLPITSNKVLELMKENHLSFPVIFKPDLGERGWMVKKIKNEQDATSYLAAIRTDFIIQEFVDLPLEFSVFYVRHPDQDQGAVTSVTLKEMLKIEGDGVSTIKDLILDLDRAKLRWQSLKVTYAEKLNYVLNKGEALELVSVGNHCLGTKFLNYNHTISEEMSAAFDAISKKVDGFYFGRYDLRTNSLEDLENAKVKVMELNGCGAEPSHIYHPGASIIDGIRDLFIHWHTIYRISRTNHKRGVSYLPFAEGVKVFKKFKAATAEQ